jgi:hypothetical protein
VSDDHPTALRLQQRVTGHLDGPNALAVDEHAVACPLCRISLARLAGGAAAPALDDDDAAALAAAAAELPGAVIEALGRRTDPSPPPEAGELGGAARAWSGSGGSSTAPWP